MGYALAEELANRGAEVILISGPVSISLTHNKIKRIDVVSAHEMYEQVMKYFHTVDAAIMAAAVADFTPAQTFDAKQKSNTTGMSITLQPTVDIAQEIGKIKREEQIVVGFALETNDEEQNAIGKIKKKNFNFIVLNSLNDPGAGFQHDTNKITIISATGHKKKFELKSKKAVAKDIIDNLAVLIK